MSDKRKQSLYFPEEMLNEIKMKQTDRTGPCLGCPASLEGRPWRNQAISFGKRRDGKRRSARGSLEQIVNMT